MIKIEANSLSELARKAVNKCKEKPVTNLILYGIFPYEEVNSEFVKMNDEIAAKWQNPSKPNDLFINHGEYIHKYGDGKKFLVDELRRKKDSNRACLSLINMEDIINSSDDPIPSFLILQFGFPEGASNKILVTAYFRALEVSQFLQINLAEISQNIRFLKGKFPSIKYFELTLIAFRAHFISQFHCLKKTSIDIADPIDIAIAVDHKELPQLREWLDSKIVVSESVICTDGLEVLYIALEKCKGKYEKSLLMDIKEALNDTIKLREIRKASSHAEEINNLSTNIKNKLQSAREKIT